MISEPYIMRLKTTECSMKQSRVELTLGGLLSIRIQFQMGDVTHFGNTAQIGNMTSQSQDNVS